MKLNDRRQVVAAGKTRGGYACMARMMQCKKIRAGEGRH
jgi:hypothetical protein